MSNIQRYEPNNKPELYNKAELLHWSDNCSHLPISERIVREVSQPEKALLATVISETIFNRVKLFTRETPASNIEDMVKFVLEETKGHDPLFIWQNVSAKVMKRKVYGIFTPFDLNELLEEAREEWAIELEREHELRKGADNHARTSSRINEKK